MDANTTSSSGDGSSAAAYANLPHDDKRRSTIVAIWLLTALSFVFLAARLLCKIGTRRRLWWDDHVIVASWIALTVSVALASWAVALGEGLHVWDAPPAHFGTIGFLGNLIGTFSILGAVWSKTSFALTLLRLMSTPRMRVVLWLAIGSMNVAMGLNALFLWVRCAPLIKTWNPSVPGTCWAPQVYPIYGIFAAGYSAVMDVVLALLPWKIVWRLQMKRQEKLGVAIAMSLGVVAGAMAIVKTSQIPSLSSGDFTYASIPLVVWGAAESAVTIMAASIPVLRVLLRDARQLTLRHYQVSTAGGGEARGTVTGTSGGGAASGVVVVNGGSGSMCTNTSESDSPLGRHSRKLRDEESIEDDERALRSIGSQQTMQESMSKEMDTFSIRVGLCDESS